MDGTGHVDIPIDTILNLRTSVTFDDGSSYAIENGVSYWVQNTGSSEVSICERATSRSVPALTSDDAVLIPDRDWVKVDVKENFNYFVWSLNAPSKVSVGKI